MRDVYPYSREAIWLFSNQRLSHHGLSTVYTWPSELGHHIMAITSWPSQHDHHNLPSDLGHHCHLYIPGHRNLAIRWAVITPDIHTWPSQLGHHITYSKCKAISAARHSAPFLQYPLDLLDGFRRSCPIFLVLIVFGFLTAYFNVPLFVFCYS